MFNFVAMQKIVANKSD